MVDTVTADESSSFPPGRSTFAAGELVADRFRIKRLVGRGGMGAVYEAVDTALENQTVALKTILPDVQHNATALRRFKREALYARMITHPNVCRVFDVGQHVVRTTGDETQVTFVTMEYLSGETLWTFLQQSGALSIARAFPIVKQIAAGLGAAHAVGIVHRDVKTPNIMLVPASAGPRAVVTDFGVACLSEDDSNLESRLTKTGSFIGSPYYIAPEQLESSEVSAATDIYSFGVVIYEMLTANFPFTGSSSMGIAMRRLHHLPTPPREYVPSIDPGWEAIILRCLARSPEDRFQSAADIVRAIEELSIPTRISPPPTPEPVRTAPGRVRPQRKSSALWTSLALTAIVIVIVGLSWMALRKSRAGGNSEVTVTATTAVNPAELRAAADTAYQAGDYALARRNLEPAADAGDAEAQARLGSLHLLGLGGPCDLLKARELLEAAADQHSSDGEGWLAFLDVARDGDGPRGFALAKKSAERGNLIGIVALGIAHRLGRGVEKNTENAMRYERLSLPGIRERADKGDPFGLTALATLYTYDQGVLPHDETKVAELNGKAAARGYPTAMTNLAIMYANGQGGLPVDEAKALELYRKAADQNSARAQVALGVMYENGDGGLPKDAEAAVALYTKAANQGNANGRVALGGFYEFGTGGLAVDKVKAVDLYQKAAAQGDAAAQYSLARLYAAGEGGLTKNDPKAVELFTASANQGYGDAQVALGYRYATAEGGLSRDDVKAVALYQRAAAQGNSFGQNNLGAMYADGRGGLQKDQVKAAELYAKASAQGNSYAQNNLGNFYEHGLGGLPVNLDAAIALFRKSAAQGNENAKNNLKRLGVAE